MGKAYVIDWLAKQRIGVKKAMDHEDAMELSLGTARRTLQEKDLKIAHKSHCAVMDHHATANFDDAPAAAPAASESAPPPEATVPVSQLVSLMQAAIKAGTVSVDGNGNIVENGARKQGSTR